MSCSNKKGCPAVVLACLADPWTLAIELALPRFVFDLLWGLLLLETPALFFSSVTLALAAPFWRPVPSVFVSSIGFFGS